MSDTTITITDEARQTLHEMRGRVFDVEETFGRGSPEHIAVMQSLLNALLDIFRLGGRVTPDSSLGELSLYSVSFIHYGVVFHRQREDGHYHPLLGEWSIHS